MPSNPIFQRPIGDFPIWETGDAVLRAYLDLELGDDQGGWHPATFRVDSGSDMTMVLASWAKDRNLPLGLGPFLITRTTADGQRRTVIVRSGLLKARVVGLDQTIYHFPCYFIGDPDDPAPPAGSTPPRLLGLTGVVDKLLIRFDGTPLPTAPHGVIVIQKQ